MVCTIRTLSALMMVLGGCSFAMRGVDPGWDGKQDPLCTDSYQPVFDDMLMTTLIGGGIGLVVGGELPIQDAHLEAEIVTPMVIISLLYAVSAVTGANKYKACRVAKAEWYANAAIEERRAHAGVAPTTIDPSGYFCMSSPSQAELNLCMRGRPACEHARKILAMPDSEDCAPRYLAWCFTIAEKPRCFATQHACEVQSVAAGAGSSACTERP